MESPPDIGRIRFVLLTGRADVGVGSRVGIREKEGDGPARLLVAAGRAAASAAEYFGSGILVPAAALPAGDSSLLFTRGGTGGVVAEVGVTRRALWTGNGEKEVRAGGLST